MPPKTSSKGAARQPPGDEWDDFLADLPDENPAPAPAPTTAGTGKNKRNGPEVDELGITQALDLKKRPRQPKPKLDGQLLLSEKGIPQLRSRVEKVKLKGKGHEWTDAARLLSLYRLWLDDLFPKAKFLDALAMVEKAGHGKDMRLKRMELINEGKPQSAAVDEDDTEQQLPQQGGHQGEEQQRQQQRRTETSVPRNMARITPIFDQPAITPAQVAARSTAAPTATAQQQNMAQRYDAYDPFDGEDLYGASPREPMDEDVIPEVDELDALMAEADAPKSTGSWPDGGGTLPSAGTGGDGANRSANIVVSGPDEDDYLDVLIAEAEAEKQAAAPAKSAPQATTTTTTTTTTTSVASIFGDGKPEKDSTKVVAEGPPTEEDFMEDEQAMAELGVW